MLLFQLGSWAWSGMNLATSAYLSVTCIGLAAVIASLRITSSRKRRLGLFSIVGSVGLAALSSFFLVYRLSKGGISDGGPLYVAGVPFNLNVMYALTALGSAAAAAFASWDCRNPSGTAS